MKKLAGLLLLLALLAVPVSASEREHTVVNKNATGTGATSAATLWTPTSGNAFYLQGCMASANNASITVRFQVASADVIPPIRFESTGRYSVESGGAVIYESAKDAVLTYTITGGGAWSVLCWGWEERA